MKLFLYDLKTGQALFSPPDDTSILIVAATAEDARKAVTELERMEALKLEDNYSYPVSEAVSEDL